MANVNVNTLTTKLNGRWVKMTDFMRTGQHHVLQTIFYDHSSLLNPKGDIRPKDIKKDYTLMDDGYTVRWRDLDWNRSGTTVLGAVSASATTINVATGTGALFAAGDEIFIPSTFETFTVTAVSTDALTVTPAVGSGWIASLAEIHISRHTIDKEGTINGKASTLEIWPEQTNYITHDSYSVAFTQEELNTILLRYTQMGKSENEAVKDYVNERYKKASQEMLTDMLRALYVGKKAVATVGGNTHRTCGWLEEFRDTTVVDVAGETTTMAKLNKLIEAVDEIQRVAPTSEVAKVILVVNDKAYREINSWVDGLNLQRYSKEVTALWWNIRVIQTSYGELPIMTCPELQNLTKSLGNGVWYAFAPSLIEIAGAVQMLDTNGTGKKTTQPSIITEPWMVAFVPEGTRKQPNAPTTVNLYTNYSFLFKGASLGLYKRIKF